MPIYEYIHPDTGEIFEDIRPVSERDKPFTHTDGKKCKRKEITSLNGWRGDREGFEIDADYYRQLNPKYVQFRDGHKERYDPSKHR
ncbi:MAG: hypothetical protein WDA06_00035 [Phenylobacterium sp.]